MQLKISIECDEDDVINIFLAAMAMYSYEFGLISLCVMQVKKKGFPIALYLDAKTNSFVEEFSTSNFVAIDKSGTYVTPDSAAILRSITNKSLMQIAADEGHVVERRQVPIEEVLAGGFSEVGACGTAVVVTPVKEIGA